MKKAIAGGLLFISIIPFNAFAVTSASVGIEFLSPLVQTIIGLLQERIAILSAENTNLRQQVASCQTAPVLGSAPIVQNDPAPVTPVAPVVPSVPVPPVVQAPVVVPQTVSVSYVYRTDAPYVAQGNTKDRCPTFTLVSDKQFFVQKLAFYAPGAQKWSSAVQEAGDLTFVGDVGYVTMNGKGAKLQNFRACFGNIYVAELPTFEVTLLGAETLIYGADGVRIPIQDVVFTY